MELRLLSHESLEDLSGNIKIIQNKNLYRFNEDSVLLADFTRVDKKSRVVDLGTGSGVLLLLLFAREPSIEGVGVEIQRELAEMASRSVSYNGLAGKIKVINNDLKNAQQFLTKNSWDLVVSNPPYIPKGKGRTSPRREIAIARQEIYCTLQDVINTAAMLLKPGGSFAMVHRVERLPEIMVLFKKNDLEPRRMQLVAASENKAPYLVLIQSWKNSSPGLEVLPQKNLNECWKRRK